MAPDRLLRKNLLDYLGSGAQLPPTAPNQPFRPNDPADFAARSLHRRVQSPRRRAAVLMVPAPGGGELCRSRRSDEDVRSEAVPRSDLCGPTGFRAIVSPATSSRRICAAVISPACRWKLGPNLRSRFATAHLLALPGRIARVQAQSLREGESLPAELFMHVFQPGTLTDLQTSLPVAGQP